MAARDVTGNMGSKFLHCTDQCGKPGRSFPLAQIVASCYCASTVSVSPASGHVCADGWCCGAVFGTNSHFAPGATDCSVCAASAAVLPPKWASRREHSHTFSAQ
eukprot:s1703_g15.t1